MTTVATRPRKKHEPKPTLLTWGDPTEEQTSFGLRRKWKAGDYMIHKTEGHPYICWVGFAEYDSIDDRWLHGDKPLDERKRLSDAQHLCELHAAGITIPRITPAKAETPKASPPSVVAGGPSVLMTAANRFVSEPTKEIEPMSATATKPRKSKKAKSDKKAAAPKADKKMSALDAAAAVLKSAGEPMNTTAMIEAMAKKGLWESPNGKTPAATLYAAILREITVKGKESRFKKSDRGLFVFAG